MASAPGPSMARMRKAVIHHDDGDDEEDDDDEFNDRAIFRGATVLDGSSAVVVMRVEGLVSAEADNSQHKVSLTDLSLEADLVYVAVPSLSSSAFLQVRPALGHPVPCRSPVPFLATIAGNDQEHVRLPSPTWAYFNPS